MEHRLGGNDMKASQKMKYFKPGIFNQLQEAAQQARTKGRQVIDLSVGSPDLPPAQKIIDTLSKWSADPEQYGYTLGGITRFNEAVADYYQRVNQVHLDPRTEVLQTMGSQEGLVHLPLAFCEPGDIVLITNPAYVAYEAGIRLAGAEPYAMELKAEHDFLPQLEEVPASLLKRAKLMILNLPGNPIPATATHLFFEKVVAFAKENDILVVHDAAYSEFYYDENQPISFLSVDGAKEVGIETNSLSKSFSLAGARIAYFVGQAASINVLRQLKSNLDYGVFAPIQEAAIVALHHAEEITSEVRRIFSERHTFMVNQLTELGFEVAPSKSGMFIWAKLPFDADVVSFSFRLIEEAGVVVVPGTAFGSAGENYVRIALVQPLERLEEAMKQLKDFFERIDGHGI